MESVLQFESPCNVIVSGMTGSGKTCFVNQLLKHANGVFKHRPTSIFYCQGVWQGLYDEMKASIPSIQFVEGLPSKEMMESWAWKEPGHKVLVIDDQLRQAAKSDDIVDLFTKFSHHLNFSVFFIVQNLFSGGKQFRTIALNAHYLCLFRNNRDEMQVQMLGRQIMPGKTSFFLDAYRKATSQSYGYLLIDVSPHSNPQYKLRTNILPNQLMIVYLPKDKP